MLNRSVAWFIWAISAAIPALMVRNPLYLAIIGLCAWLVHVSVSHRSGMDQSWRALVKLGALVWLLTIPFNALMIHEGERTVFELPQSWPLVGGKITLEAILLGVASGLQIWVLLIIFTAFNMSIDVSQLLRLTPSFLYQAGIVVSIALTFVPQMLASAREIREAQRVRGHRFRGWRDSLPLFAPLITTAFEHAVQLAESMESRGFGSELSSLAPKQATRMRLQLLLSLLLLLCGLFLYGFWASYVQIGLALMGVAAILLLIAFRSVSRRVRRSHYRRGQWDWGDTAVAATSALALAGTLAVRLGDPSAFVYYPYPPNSIQPAFNAWIGLLFALYALPGLLSLSRDPLQSVPPPGALGRNAR